MILGTVAQATADIICDRDFTAKPSLPPGAKYSESEGVFWRKMMGTSLNVHNPTKCVPLVAAVAVSSPLLAKIPTSRLFGKGREGGSEGKKREGKGRGEGGEGR